MVSFQQLWRRTLEGRGLSGRWPLLQAYLNCNSGHIYLRVSAFLNKACDKLAWVGIPVGRVVCVVWWFVN